VQLAKKMTDSYGQPCDPGLSDEEIAAAEAKYSIRFPNELREFLKVALPRSFFQWRSNEPSDIQAIQHQLEWPLEGLLFSFTHDDIWYPGWGERPKTTEEIEVVIRREYAKAPPLVPLYIHRYMPLLEGVEIVPVLSVHGADIIYYGGDLESYLDHEFGSRRRDWQIEEPPIPFWDIFLDCLYD
jgi:hypothetical protein